MARLTIYAICLAAVISTYLVGTKIDADHKDIWMGLFTSAVQVCFVVFIIENLMRFETARRNRPARAAGYRHARMIYGRARQLWGDMVQSAFEAHPDIGLLDAAPASFLDTRWCPLVATLDLNSDSRVLPARPWRVRLQSELADLELQIGACLQRYAAFLDPKMIYALQDLERTPFLSVAKLCWTPDVFGSGLTDHFRFNDSSLVEALNKLGDELIKQFDDVKDLLPEGTTPTDDEKVLVDRLRAAHAPGTEARV